MRIGPIAVVVLLAGCAPPPPGSAPGLVDRAKKDKVIMVGDDDAAMAKAFQQARAGLDEFLAMARKPPAHYFSVAVKVGVTDKGATEFFWLLPFRETATGYVGAINNNPELVSSVKMGQDITFEKKEIVDWMYVDTAQKRMFGNFTLCALLTKENPEEARDLKKRIGLECEA
jgi:uncharacterized protein YegJ (DUF2314 family)